MPVLDSGDQLWMRQATAAVCPLLTPRVNRPSHAHRGRLALVSFGLESKLRVNLLASRTNVAQGGPCSIAVVRESRKQVEMNSALNPLAPARPSQCCAGSSQKPDMKLTRGPCNLSLMNLALPVCQPFSLARSIEFIRGFCAISDDYELTPTSITAAVWRDGAGHWFRLSGDREVTLELSPRARRCADRGSFVGARMRISPFYAAAEDDPPMRARAGRQLVGLHHVTRHRGDRRVLRDAARTDDRARALRQVPHRIPGHPVITPTGEILRAMPQLAMLATLDGAAIGTAIGHGPRARRSRRSSRGPPGLGEEFLATAPYAVARDRCSRSMASVRSRRRRSCCAASDEWTSCRRSRCSKPTSRAVRHRIRPGRDHAALRRVDRLLGVLPEGRDRPWRTPKFVPTPPRKAGRARRRVTNRS